MYDIDDPGKESWASLPNHCWDAEDLVDFPCSDDFLRMYNQKGMTPRCPEPNVQTQLNEMSSRLERLEAAVRARGHAKPVTAQRPVYQLPYQSTPAQPREEAPVKHKSRGIAP